MYHGLRYMNFISDPKFFDRTLEYAEYPKVLSIGTPKSMNFPFVPNGKLMVLGVPIFKHIGVVPDQTALIRVCAVRFMVNRFKSTYKYNTIYRYILMAVRLNNIKNMLLYTLQYSVGNLTF